MAKKQREESKRPRAVVEGDERRRKVNCTVQLRTERMGGQLEETMYHRAPNKACYLLCGKVDGLGRPIPGSSRGDRHQSALMEEVLEYLSIPTCL